MDSPATKVRATTRMTFREFAAFYFARPDQERWELIDGEAIMRPPMSRTHERIADTVDRLLNDALTRSRPEWTADREIGVHVPEEKEWTAEPDVTVSNRDIPPGAVFAERLHFAERFYFVVEVLSNDHPDVLARRRAYYRSHAHNRGIMFVSQDSISVELVRRTADGWATEILTDPSAMLDLPDIGMIGRLSEIYRTTELEPK